MPSRLLREGILDSEAVNSLSAPAEVFYRRLMSVVDDFGRFDGRPAILKGRLYALKPDVRETDISRWIAECEKAGLIALYDAGGKPYLLFKKLGPARAKESKYPAPPSTVDTKPPANTHPFTDVNKREQTFASVPYSDSYSGTDSGSGTRPTSGTEPGPSVSPPTVPFDPLRADQEARKLFEQRWKAAGLRMYSRLSPTLQNTLAALLLDSWWAENYPAALAKAGTIPFLRDGIGRANGPMDVAFFLRSDDEARKIIDGTYDPRVTAGDAGPTKTKTAAGIEEVLRDAAAKQEAARQEAAKRKAG